MIVWVSDRQGSVGPAVRGRRYNPAGVPTSTEFLNRFDCFGVSTESIRCGARPRAVLSSPGLEAEGIYVQRVSSAGSKLGSVLHVSNTAARVQFYPIVSALKDGGFVLVFELANRDGSGLGVFGRRYNADGTPAGTWFFVNTAAIKGQYQPAATGLRNGGFHRLLELGQIGFDGARRFGQTSMLQAIVSTSNSRSTRRS